jgi:tRNA-2-methylthio-N6-dimethylallyladenosine synthase
MIDKDLEAKLEKIDITGPAPIKDPERQYYFIKKCRKYVKEKSEELGRPLTACSRTFGCQMNARDSEKLSGILREAGYVETESEDADFVIYNTCTVRENANLRVYGRLGVLHGYKKKNPNMKIALCGWLSHLFSNSQMSFRGLF